MFCVRRTVTTIPGEPGFSKRVEVNMVVTGLSPEVNGVTVWFIGNMGSTPYFHDSYTRFMLAFVDGSSVME